MANQVRAFIRINTESVKYFLDIKIICLDLLKNKNMLYKKLKRTWSHNYSNYIPRFRETFPELSKLTPEEMADRWINLDLEFYSEVPTPVPLLIRLSLPLAILIMLLMLIMLPIVFLATGNWHYPLGDNCYLLNWFRSLRLL